MNTLELQYLLGKSISEVERVINNDLIDFSNNDLDYLLYSTNENFSIEYFGLVSKQIIVMTDKKMNTKSVSIHFSQVIDRKFYNSFIEKHGEPDHIQIMGDLITKSKESYLRDEEGNIVQTARKKTFDLRDGTFEEKPLFIIWNKEDFQIRALLRHENNISQITFSIPEK